MFNLIKDDFEETPEDILETITKMLDKEIEQDIKKNKDDVK